MTQRCKVMRSSKYAPKSKSTNQSKINRTASIIGQSDRQARKDTPKSGTVGGNKEVELSTTLETPLLVGLMGGLFDESAWMKYSMHPFPAVASTRLGPPSKLF